MPPRKKAAAADGTASVPTRSSARTKAAAAASASTIPAAVPVPAPAPAVAPAKAPPKGKAKRARAASESGDDAPPVKTAKAASKKAKKTKDEDVDMDDEAKDDDDKKVDDEPKKMVTVIKRGAAPVDPVSGKVDTHQVYQNSEAVWDAMLNQTDVSSNQNKNKFYVLQLLHPLTSDATCTLFTRWGRVGEDGQTQVKGPWPTGVAINEFNKQFKAKAGVDWKQRVGMVPKKGKYVWLERDYEDEEDEKEDKKAGSSKADVVIPDSGLEPELQDLCKLIFSTSIIDAHLSSMNYDAKKLPLGKLAKSTILSGFAALKRLAEVLQNPSGATANEFTSLQAAYEQLTGAYYSIIPHDFGRQRPTVINSQDILKRELDLVDALGDMEIASKLISSSIPQDEDGNPINHLDANFRSLNLSAMEPVAKGSDEYSTLERYVRDTHGATHNIRATVQHIFRVERAGETDAWIKGGYDKLQDGEKMLLWHGSRSTNFAGILKQGLRIAPPEAPVTGYMFGKGVYFADMMSKSANYCYAYLSNGTGLLLLCEVATHPFFERNDALYDADVQSKVNNKRSTKGIGRTAPTKWKDAGKALNNPDLNGCHMPDGPGESVNPPGAYLQYNEYIVYDPAQIRLKYLLMVNM